MIGFQKLDDKEVRKLNIGTQVFIKLTGDSWTETEIEENESLYHLGSEFKLWDDEGKNFFYLYENKDPGYEFDVYIPAMKYKMDSIIKDVKIVIDKYGVTVDDVCDKIRRACRGS